MTYDEAKEWIFENIPDYVPPKPQIGDFSKMIMPVIANMAPANLIDDLVAVQPMTAPAQTAFYLDFIREPWWRRWWRKVISCLGSSVSRARD